MPESNPTQPESSRGRLKVFLGYAPGVGKSFRMFDEARRRKERGQDIVVAALQPPISPDLAPIVDSLEVIPTLDFDGVPVIDVATILRRNPQVCVVDGLAYDSRQIPNPHRWQDVERLLAAGINVITTVNLQHIEDQRDAVERLTGRLVDETVPRDFLNTADEIEVVDASTEEAPPSFAELRERALVLSADVIDAGLQRYLSAHDLEPAARTRERFLVCLTAWANAGRMLASARQSAASFHCDVLALCVNSRKLSPADQLALDKNLAEARAAGAGVDVLEDADPVEAIARYASTHGVTQILVGHSLKKDWRTRLWGSPVSRLIRIAEGIDVRVFPH